MESSLKTIKANTEVKEDYDYNMLNNAMQHLSATEERLDIGP